MILTPDVSFTNQCTERREIQPNKKSRKDAFMFFPDIFAEISLRNLGLTYCDGCGAIAQFETKTVLQWYCKLK